MRFEAFILALLMSSPQLLCFSQDNLLFQTNAGIIVPTKPDNPERFPDSWRRGLSLGGGVGYILSDYFALIGNVSYTYFRFSGKYPPLAAPPEWEVKEIKWGKSHLLESSLDLMLSENKAENKLHLFLSVGLGYLTQRIGNVEIYWRDFVNNIEDCDTTYFSGTSDKGFFLSVATGINVQILKGFTLFVEGRLSTSLDGNNSYFPIKVGIRF